VAGRARPGRSGWIDAIWSLAVGLVGAGAALVPLDGTIAPRQGLVAAMVALWGLRLGAISRCARQGMATIRVTPSCGANGGRFPARLFLSADPGFGGLAAGALRDAGRASPFALSRME
jgi:hypothetical protein